MSKRFFEFILALFLYVFLSPLFIILMFLIPFIDGVFPLYWDERYGLHGKKFRILKFQTMKPGSNQR